MGNFAVAWARPYYLFSGPITAYLLMLVGFLIGFGWSFEAGSVWCWSALGLHVYFWAQPYLFDKPGNCVKCLKVVYKFCKQAAEKPEKEEALLNAAVGLSHLV